MKRRAPPSHEPHPCVVLGVDTAQVSGWCVMVRGLYQSSGQFDLLREPHGIAGKCGIALALGDANDLPVVLVYERPFMGTAQGQYIGAWKAAWAAAGGVKSRTVGVYPATWRARVLGMARAARETARRAEQQLAKRIAGREVGGDEAPAVCIARWGSHAGEVLAKLPPSARKGAA